MKALIVVHPFDDYRRGDAITDPATVTEVWATRRAAVTLSMSYQLPPVPTETAAEPAKSAAPEPVNDVAPHAE